MERTTPPARRIELGAQSMPMLVGGSRPLVQGCFLVKEKEIFFFFVYLFQQTLEGSRSQNFHQSRVVGSQSQLLTKSCHGLFFIKQDTIFVLVIDSWPERVPAMSCLPLSVVQLKGIHCRKPHCGNGVVDMFGLGVLVLLKMFQPVY